MAGRKILDPSKTLPAATGIQPVDEEPSVFDTPIDKILRLANKAAKLYAGETPEEQLMTTATMGAPAGPLVTFFENKAARQAGTRKFLDAAKRLATDSTQMAAEYFAEKYPRIAAHINLRSHTQTPDELLDDTERFLKSEQSSFAQPPASQNTKVGILESSPNYEAWKSHIKENYGREAAQDFELAEDISTMFHEGTHVAQYLMNKDADYYNTLIHDLISHADRPSEYSSRYSGNKAVKSLVGEKNPLKEIQSERELQLGQFISDRHLPHLKRAAYHLEDLATSQPPLSDPNKVVLLDKLKNWYKQRYGLDLW